MTEQPKSKNKEDEEEEQRLRERIKAKQESRRRQQENSEENPDGSKGKDGEEASKDGNPMSSSSSRDGSQRSSSDHGNADMTTQQKRRSRRRRRERRRQHREARREGFPPPPRFYHDYGPPPPPPGPYGYRGGPDGPRWERGGPMPPMRGGYHHHPPPFPPPHGPHGHPGDWGPRGPPPPGWRGPPPPFHRNPRDEYGREQRFRGRSRSLSSRSRSRSRTVSPSRSPSRDSSISRSPSRTPSRGSSSKRSRSDEEGNRRRHHKRRRHHRHSRRRSPSSSSASDSASASSSSSDESESEDKKNAPDASANALTKDQRTVFVTQLVMRTTEKELRKYFKKKLGCKVMDVELLRDKRTGRHKGSAYVELGRLEDVGRALQASGQAPDFQRFPILVKASEAEKNYIIPASSATLTASMVLGSAAVDTSPLVGPNGKLLESQKVYVGNLDPRVTQEHLFALFSQFGSLQKVNMQLDPETRQSKGFCFLSFRDPKEANLAIQTMSNLMLAGRPMRTGWASQASSIPGVEIVTSDEFPDDAATRIQNANLVLSQLTGGAVTSAVSHVPAVMITTAEAAINAAMGISTDASNVLASSVPTVAEARAVATAQTNLVSVTNATAPVDDPKVIGNSENPTQHLLIRNMFDKDEETEDGWEEDIRLDFEEECTKYGKLIKVVVMSKEPGGKIYASFESIEGAQTCARSLAGRWFAKRQLRVEFCNEDHLPKQ